MALGRTGYLPQWVRSQTSLLPGEPSSPSLPSLLLSPRGSCGAVHVPPSSIAEVPFSRYRTIMEIAPMALRSSGRGCRTTRRSPPLILPLGFSGYSR